MQFNLSSNPKPVCEGSQSDEELQQDKTVAKIATVVNRGIRVAKKFVFSMIIRTFAPSVPTKPLNDAQMRGAFLYIYVYSQNTLMERLPHFMKHYMMAKVLTIH